VSFARIAQAAQVQRFIVVSAAAADPSARNFYLRTKGEMEEAVAALKFSGLDILQPGFLLGWRREMRPLELAASVLFPVVNPLLVGARTMYRAIPARTVALAMLGAARSGRRGVSRYSYTALLALAQKGAAPRAL
jgi:uncharacterized protein YbjT (DUF2867 family)